MYRDYKNEWGERAKPRALTLGCGKLLKLVEMLLGD